ncbi:MAG TPA: hypothetical protein VGU68_02285 [Ktedonobacteraceae bacterium]|nr:hypothetical protein [Ktedonobacteraceae bacterium]
MRDDNLDDVQPWSLRDEYPTASPAEKRALAAHYLGEPFVAMFDGEAGTYSDPRCYACSPVYVAWPE